MRKTKIVYLEITAWSFICAFVIFSVLFGLSPLNVRYDDWIRQAGGDSVQHYLGWVFYRDSDWKFPFGMTDGTSFPNWVSIIYTDSIPIFALFFKAISFLLPETFQYIGLYVLMSFFLQALFMIIIVRSFTRLRPLWMISAVFAILSPVMLNRVFGHAALSGHFLILAGFALWIYRKSFSRRKELALWVLLGAFGVSIHMYFIPMIGMIMLARLLEELICERFNMRVLRWGCILAGMFIVCSAMVMFALGGFSGGFSKTSGGYGAYNSNLNTLFNPLGKSAFLEDLPIREGQWEGTGYLGLGGLIMGIIAFLLTITDGKIRASLKNRKAAMVSAGLLFLVVFGLATAFKIYLNEIRIIDINLPGFLNACFSIFRCSGRFIWVISYIVIIYGLYVLAQKKKAGMVILMVCTLVQAADLYRGYHRDLSDMTYESGLPSSFWQDAPKRYKHIAFVNEHDYLGNGGRREMFKMADYAAMNHMTVNKFYYARPYTEVMRSETAKVLAQLSEGTADRDSIYVFTKYYIWNQEYPGLHLYKVDDIIIGTYHEEDLDIYDNMDKVMDIALDAENYYILNGEDTGEGRKINSNGLIFGPYISLTPGRYKVIIEGEDLKEALIDMNPQIPLQIKSWNDERIEYTFIVQDQTYNAEFTIENSEGGENLLVKSIKVERLEGN